MRDPFDDKVAAWDAYTRSPGGQLRRELILRNLAAHGLIAKGSKVLDTAGGTGDTALELAIRGCLVTLLDLSAEMLSLAQERAAAAGLEGLTCVQADANSIDGLLSVQSFDLILIHSLLAFVPDPSGLLGSLTQLLSSGGALSVVFGNRYHFPFRFALRDGDAAGALEALTTKELVAGTDLFGQPRKVFDPADVLLMIEGAGLKAVGTYGLRVFADLVPGGIERPEVWLALEAAAGGRSELSSVARFNQIIAVR